MINTRILAAEYRLTHWAEIMRERNASGLSIRSYCKSIGIHENVYYYWQKKLREVTSEQLSSLPMETMQTKLIPAGFAEVKLETVEEVYC